MGTEWQRVLKMLSDFPQHRFRFFLSSYCSSSSGDNIIFGLWNFKCSEKTCEMSMVDISIIKFALHEKVSFFYNLSTVPNENKCTSEELTLWRWVL